MGWRGAAGVAVLVLALAGCGGGEEKVAAESGNPPAGIAAGEPSPGNGAPTPSASESPTAGGTSDSSGSGIVDLDETASSPPNEAPAGKARPGTTDTAEIVVPRAGMSNTHTVTFDKTELRGDRTIRVYFYGGVEPCSVLDSAKVVETDTSVTITLRSGADPAKPDAMCIQIAKYKAVDVKLSKDLGERKIVDGSAETN